MFIYSKYFRIFFLEKNFLRKNFCEKSFRNFFPEKIFLEKNHNFFPENENFTREKIAQNFFPRKYSHWKTFSGKKF